MNTYAIRHSLRCLCDLYVPICSTRQAWRQKKRCIVSEPDRPLAHRTYVSGDVHRSHKLRRRIRSSEIRCSSSDISTSAGHFCAKMCPTSMQCRCDTTTSTRIDRPMAAASAYLLHIPKRSLRETTSHARKKLRCHEPLCMAYTGVIFT